VAVLHHQVLTYVPAKSVLHSDAGYLSTTMDAYIYSSMNGILAVKDGFPELTLPALIAVLIIFSLIATRVITGLQSQPKRLQEGESHAVRTLPYWIPWIGHSISFFNGNRDFVARARFVAVSDSMGN
jgi:hypothetical protein